MFRGFTVRVSPRSNFLRIHSRRAVWGLLPTSTIGGAPLEELGKRVSVCFPEKQIALYSCWIYLMTIWQILKFSVGILFARTNVNIRDIRLQRISQSRWSGYSDLTTQLRSTHLPPRNGSRAQLGSAAVPGPTSRDTGCCIESCVRTT